MRVKIELDYKPGGLIIAHSKDCMIREAFKANYNKEPACVVNRDFGGVGGVKRIKVCTHYCDGTIMGTKGEYSLECSI